MAPLTAAPPAAPRATRPSVLSGRALAQWKQRRETPPMLSDWDRTLMVHYAVDPAELQPQIPFPLDLHGGVAYVSLVAFTLRGLRPRFLPVAARRLLRPVSEHGFLNLRTYVRVGKSPGIYFLAEWLPNRLSILLGPPIYGLPYRFGHLDYQHDHEHGRLDGRVDPGDEPEPLVYRYQGPPLEGFAPAERDTLNEFLLERYTAFTQRGRVRRRFDIWHRPWPQTRVEELDLIDDRLTRHTGPWRDAAQPVLAHYSPGVRDVWLGRPHRLRDAA
ncbi:MAG: DUF2071 domain-containing protein [Planctomycetota bacterium]